jgi:hypothetical protein
MSGIVIGAVALLSIAWIGTVLYIRREKRAHAQHHNRVAMLWARADSMDTDVICKLRDRLEKVEQWERWIVKLQTQIKELQKAGPGPHSHFYLETQVEELGKASKRTAEFCQILVPLARAIHAGTEVATKQAAKAYSPKKREALEPTWEKLTSRPVHMFEGTGVTYTGTK